MVTDELRILRACGGPGVNRREDDVQEAIDRAVRNEARLQKIERTGEATHDLMEEVRKDAKAHRETLTAHLGEDNQRFASIDTRLQGFQTQLSMMSDSVQRIERSTEHLERAARDSRNFWAALRTQWAFVAGGAMFASTMIGMAVALISLLN